MNIAYANDATTKPANKSISLSIKPGLCVLAENETECRDTLRVKWKSVQQYSLCLYQKAEEQSLYCWRAAQEGEYQFAFVASKTTEFELRDLDSQEILIAKAFKILTRESRSRRRNPWNFF